MSISFDRATAYYDATRGYPAGVEQGVADAIVTAAAATPTTRFLEMGIGTGRIAFPLITRGYMYTGIDLSEKMMALLRQKLSDYATAQPTAAVHANLLQGDVTQLPYADASFDVALMVHVLHLIPNWRDAISEALRVLVPGGVLLNGYDEAIQTSDARSVQRQWFEILRELGYEAGGIGPAGFSNGNEVLAELEARGLAPEKLRTITWSVAESPQQAIEHIANRQWSRTWSIPDDIFTASVARLSQEAAAHFGDQLMVPKSREFQFVMLRVRKP
ncbi:MAG: class I SAM-dependent methyltransferase [Ktedonobacterales bacterium]|nr:class I SAM-dependent methyltransferase [Ktedonobacterales bacterium]